MRAKTKTPWPAVSALWSLLWRAIVLTPFAMVLGVLWALTWPMLFFGLPVWEIYFIGEREWLAAAMVLAGWVLLFLFARSRWFKIGGRRDFPNKEENV